MPIRSVAVAVLALVLLYGCGRRGELEAPGTPEPNVLAPTPDVLLGTASPGAQEPPQARPAPAPERRFILDPLI